MNTSTRLASVLLAAFTFALHAEDPGKWTSASQDTRHTLTYSGSAQLLGKSTPVSVEFQCDPKSGNQVFGTVGFDLTIRNATALKGFPFGDFEGPDAKVAALVLDTISRTGKPELSFKTQASGSFSSESAFCFSVAELSKKKTSVPKSILQALAEPGAERLLITVADPRNAKLRLEISVPVAGRQAEFQALLK